MYGNDVTAFHRKYRSKTFNEYMGNSKMKKQLMRALASETLPQVILLTGTSGGGKTTMSRLIAKEYQCQNRSEETGACNECDNCKLMNEFIETGNWKDTLHDVKEVDATAQGNKEAIDALMYDMETPSFDGNWRVYILDECHEIPKAAQNRLLKTLEEPPNKVLILLATTDPHKLLPTIMTRCQYTFEVAKPTLEEAIPFLSTVCKRENVAYDIKSFNIVCTRADFVPRQILVNLDKVIQQTGNLTYDATVEVLDSIADDLYFEFFTLLLSDHINIYKYITLISKIKDGVGLKPFITELIPFTKRGIYVMVGAKVSGLDKSEIDMYNRIFGNLSVSEILAMLETIMELTKTYEPELLLLYLGYNGIKKRKDVTDTTATLPNDSATVAEEGRESRENFSKHAEVTEEKDKEFVKEATKALTIEEIANKFGTAVVPIKTE